jgi:hypothetical protein
VRNYDPGKIPAIGDGVDLDPDDKSDPKMTVTPFSSYGVAEVMAVKDEHGQRGVVAFFPDGSWWWIRKIDPREPWATDADAWKSNGGV